MSKIASYLRLIRIPQWSKNLFIFLPAFFALKLWEPGVIYNLLITFIGFSLLASAVYVFNDMLDIEADRIHPTKRNRPLASGAVTKKEGIFFNCHFIADCCCSFWHSRRYNRDVYCGRLLAAEHCLYC